MLDLVRIPLIPHLILILLIMRQTSPNFLPAVVDQVCKLSSRCPATSGELDCVPTALPHHCISALLPTITYITYLSFKLGDLPRQFKSCFIYRPLKKSNLDRESLSNYRPISHLSFFTSFESFYIFCITFPAHLECCCTV
jgi:hypothetical protein